MKKTCQRVAACLVVLLTCLFTPFLAHAQQTPIPFTKIVFFGDSLSDNGNFYADVLGFMPKSPPYFEGRFSNGQVWSEFVDQYYFAKSLTETTNYAIGGQTAVFHNPVNGFNPYTLTMSRDNYLLHSIFTDRSQTLFVIWVGANDYLPGVKNIDELTTNVIDSIRASIESLIYHGATNFLVLNLPDLSRVPFGRTSDYRDTLKNAVIAHNLKLDAAIAELQQGYKNVNIHLYKINELFDDFMNNTPDYNSKYHTNIMNVTESCWTGGYTLRPKQITEDMIQRKIEEQLHTQSRSLKASAATPIDSAALAHYVATTPALMETFMVSDYAETGTKPCTNPDQYMFWDKVHPTAQAHKIISQKLIEFIDANYLSAENAE